MVRNDRYDRKPAAQLPGSPGYTPGELPADDEDEAVPEASSIIRLQNGMVLYLREINKSDSPPP